MRRRPAERWSEDPYTQTKGAAFVEAKRRVAEDAQSTAAWLNVALEVAGEDRRITEVRVDPADPGAVERYGRTLVDLATRAFPVPWFDNAVTRRELGYDPRPMRPALDDTVEWLRANGQVS